MRMLKNRRHVSADTVFFTSAHFCVKRRRLDRLATAQDGLGCHNWNRPSPVNCPAAFSFLKSEKDFLEMSFEFENLYLRYEQLWYDFRDGTIDDAAAKTSINELRAKEVEIEKAGVRCPRIQRWMDRVAAEVKSVLKLDLV
jgi:hypothetical protein